jgi:integrase
MNTVEPIRDRNLILDFADYLKEQSERDYVLFMFGIYSGLRVSDILPLKVRDVKDTDYLYKHEKKTKKYKRLKLNDELKPIIKEYIVGKRDYEYLFKREKGKSVPISRQRVWQILNKVADEFEYKEKIGCHTLRKTFGYWIYQETKDAATLQDIFNHSSLEYTKRYIGVNQDNQDKTINNLSFSNKRR